jgi:hypothetical protein
VDSVEDRRVCPAGRYQRAVDVGQHRGDVTVIAAHPLPVPEVDGEAVSEQRRRCGWWEILARTDQLAAECVRIAKMWDGGRDFPFSNPEQIDPNTEYGAEWSARLEPIDFEDQRETLTDPETGAPVIRQPDGLLPAAIPQRLATFSPLAAVIPPTWPTDRAQACTLSYTRGEANSPDKS